MHVLKVGTLVRWRGSIGLVMGKVTSIGAKTGDIWVKWNDDPKPSWERGARLEVISASR